MRKLLLLIMLFFVGTEITVASPVSYNKAKKKAVSFLSKQHKTDIQVWSVSDQGFLNRRMKKTVSNPPYYIFNAENGKGYALISGDDELPSLIGYSLEGQWPTDESMIPDALKDILTYYADYVDDVREGKVEATATRKQSDNPTIIVPELMTTKWNQTYPYNKYAPSYEGLSPDTIFSVSYNKHFPIGCAAVAMGQILNYHKYPTHPQPGQTTVSRKYSADKAITDTVTFDPNKTYDFANIPDSIFYTAERSNMTPEEWEIKGEAIGQFLGDIARSLNMQWSYNGGGAADEYAGESSAIQFMGISFDAETHRYADFEKGIKDPAWWDLIQTDLDNGRPVYYGGQDKGGMGGHAFVFDGYDSNHFVHVNWGWAGACNNWFDYTYLKTNQYDTHSTGGYDFASGNVMVNNIKPRAEGEVLHPDPSKVRAFGLGVVKEGDDGLPISFCAFDRRSKTDFVVNTFIPQMSTGLDYNIKLYLEDRDTHESAAINSEDSLLRKFPVDPYVVNFMHGITFPVINEALEDGKYSLKPHYQAIYNGEQTELYPSGEFRFDIRGNDFIIRTEESDTLWLGENCYHFLEETPSGQSYLNLHLYSPHPSVDSISRDSIADIRCIIQFNLSDDVTIPNPEGDKKIFATVADESGNEVWSHSYLYIEEIVNDAQWGGQFIGSYRMKQFYNDQRNQLITLSPGKYTIRVKCDVFNIDMTENFTVIGEPTGIKDAKAADSKEQETDNRYNLQGMRVNDNYKGIVISNGKKYNLQ